MEDKSQVLKLYEKMNRINIYLEDLEEMVKCFKDELNTSFKIDGKTFLEDEIDNNKSVIKNSKKVIQKDVMNDLKNYL